MTKWTIPDELPAAKRIEALEAENARLRAGHLAIIQSAPSLRYAIQTSRDALYPKEGGE